MNDFMRWLLRPFKVFHAKENHDAQVQRQYREQARRRQDELQARLDALEAEAEVRVRYHRRRTDRER